MCELLRLLAAQQLGVPITLFLDNARYQKCALLQDLAASLRIELCFLPAYSPNLNLIEPRYPGNRASRLGRWLKQTWPHYITLGAVWEAAFVSLTTAGTGGP